jgi:CDP-diacylglycerol--glycerol-3-phosphate 3-phosphatidyltransferase
MAATLYSAKPAFQRLLEPVVEGLQKRGVRPDSVTWAGIGCAAAAGVAVLVGAWAPAILMVVPLLLALRMAANAIDGQLARRTVTSVRGALLNEVCDVAGDAIAYLPFAVLLGGDAAWLVVAVVVTALIGEVAAIAGPAETRRNAGPLGKADRALAFSIVAALVAAGAPAGVLVGGLVLLLGLAANTLRNRMRIGRVL